ncbi:TPA: NAD-dependent epimerase/dehydratase family protein, partial [Citrobacter braakii]
DLIDMLNENLTDKVQVNYKPGRSFDIDISILSNALAIRELGWKPKVSIREGLGRAATWMKKNVQNSAAGDK